MICLLVISVVLTLFIALSRQHVNDSVISALSKNRIPVDGLSYREYGNIKAELIRNKKPPDHGLFGLHVIDQMTGNSYFRREGESFFNYVFLHISLFEVEHHLRYLDQQGLLPTKSLLITLPNPSLGKYQYVTNRYELNTDVYLAVIKESFERPSLRQISVVVEMTGTYFTNTLEQWLDWKNIAYGLSRIVSGVNICTGPENIDQRDLAVRSLTLLLGNLCQDKNTMYINIANGSNIYEQDSRTYMLDKEYFEGIALWKFSDAGEISKVLMRLVAFAEVRGRKIYFIVPPVYMVRDSGHINERLVDLILDEIPKKYIIDDRDLDLSSEYYFPDSYHPSELYWDGISFPQQ